MNEVFDSENKEVDFEENIRPKLIDEYIGQNEVKENLRVFIGASKIRNESLDHILLYGPPGLGKTTLAYIIANELGVHLKAVSGPSIEKPGDLAAVLTSLEAGDVLFIDEIHRMPSFIEEILYPAMEDFTLDIMVGGEGQSRSIKIDLEPFTLVGATTRAGDLTAPLRDRFGITCKLQYYSVDELVDIIKRTSRVLNSPIAIDAAIELAMKSRGTPRIANRIFRRVSDFALVDGKEEIDLEVAQKALERLKISKGGLNETDKDYLLTIIDKFNGGPVGIETLSTAIGEDISTIEDMYEPYLIQIGFVKRTSRGRIATNLAYQYFNRRKSYKNKKRK